MKEMSIREQNIKIWFLTLSPMNGPYIVSPLKLDVMFTQLRVCISSFPGHDVQSLKAASRGSAWVWSKDRAAAHAT